MVGSDRIPACWWCGQVADSREHRVKASQLKKMFRSSEFLVLDDTLGGRPTRLNGPKAKPVLFDKVLCAECNNSRSQSFDRAYDKFVDKVWDDPEYFRDRDAFNMSEIFPGDPKGGSNLARYYMKNIGCRIAEIGFSVPGQIIDFMNGSRSMQNGVLVLYRDFSVFDQFRRSGIQGHYPFANRMHAPVDPKDGPLVAFCAEIQDGPVGAIFWWDAATELGVTFCSREHTYLRERRELPYHDLHTSVWARSELMKVALDAENGI
ncbi:hypothetical protein [Dietzia cinnamea]|uniref:hypothetical protein n=1 Tax=Dietzia cinnamea TaxID=321318 RepID=UPI00223B8CEF|nr:hypothetical protein [Dietzia cinnamea]MCT2175692.1 hypothetical protein [Dietzia cinnamea]